MLYYRHSKERAERILEMKNYEIKKSATVRNRWYVLCDGEMLTYFSTKKWAKKCVEIQRIKDSGVLWNPTHPRWAELMTD